MTNSANLLEIISQLNWEESEDLEFKSAKGGLPKSLWETYSAMANTHGGVILLGVEDDGKVTGVTNTAKLKRDFWNNIHNSSKVNLNLLSDKDIAEVLYEKKTILAIHVPQANRHQRPIFLNKNPLIGAYRRNHEGDYRCTEQEVARMFSDRAEEPADSRILEGFDLADIDLTSLHQYRQRLASHKPTHPWLSEDDKGLLVKLGGWRFDRKMKQEGLTVAGILMFGQDTAIREAIPNYHVDYQEKLSEDPAVRWTDRLTADGTWCANLFQFYLRVSQRLTTDLKLPFQLDGDLLRKGETEVHEAIREALVNALIHADYQGVGGIVIQKYRDRFIFSNPGTLLISLEQLLRGNISECRNKTLQTMFTLFGAAEKAGSGVDKIRKGWASQYWRLPSVREQIKPDRVDWQLPMVSMIPKDSLTRLQHRFSDKFQNFSPPEVQALVTADIEQFVDNARMRQMTSNHATDITRMLQGLVAQGALIQEGKTRGSRYRLPNELDSPHNAIDSPHNAIDSPHNALTTEPNKANFLPNLTNNEEEELHKIAALPRNKRRLPPQKMEQIIQELCYDRWLSRKQLSELLKRDMEGLRMRFLAPMVEHGLLRLRFPDKPNRVGQAYTSTKNAN